jgi:hypothetical protein
MKLIGKPWDDIFVVVDEDLFDRAKELLQEHGIIKTTLVAKILEHQFNYPPCSDDVNRCIVIAMRELSEEREPVSQS